MRGAVVNGNLASHTETLDESKMKAHNTTGAKAQSIKATGAKAQSIKATSAKAQSIKATSAKAQSIKATSADAAMQAATLAFTERKLAFRVNRFDSETGIEGSAICTLAASRSLAIAETETENAASANGYALVESSLGFWAMDYADKENGAFALCGSKAQIKLGASDKLVAEFASAETLAKHVFAKANFKLQDGGKDTAWRVMLGKHYGLRSNGKQVTRCEFSTCKRGLALYGIKKANLAAI